MSDGLSFRDMQIRVARRMSVAMVDANGTSPPNDIGRIEMIRDAINDAMVRVVSATEWSWMVVPTQLTVDSTGGLPNSVNADPTLYRLPPEIQGVAQGSLRWSYTTLPTPSFDGPIDVRDDVYVQQMLSRFPGMSSWPQVASFVQDPGQLGTKPSWLMRIFPRPSVPFYLRGHFRRMVGRMMADADRGVWGEAVDLAIVDQAIADLATAGHMPEGTAADAAIARAGQSLALALADDARFRKPLSLGSDSPPDDVYRGRPSMSIDGQLLHA